MSVSSTRMVTLKSSDGATFVVEESLAEVSQTIKNMIDDDQPDQVILIPYASAKILSKVIDYCKRKIFESTAAASLVDEKDIKAWEREFVQVDKSTLRDLDHAAHYLALESLRDLIFQTRKDMAAGTAAVQETRKKTRIEKNYTKEEEEEMRKIGCIPKDPLELTLGKESIEGEESELWKQYCDVNDPPEEICLGKESPEYTKAEESELWKQYCIVDDPEQRDFGIPNEPPKERDLVESPEYTKAEESEFWKQYSILKEPTIEEAEEINLLKDFGKESTDAEEKARGKRKVIE